MNVMRQNGTQFAKQVSIARLMSLGGLAKLCGFAPRTIAKWCDKGLLPSMRLPNCGPSVTHGGDRRIRVADALNFCRERKFKDAATVLLALIKPLVAVVGNGNGIGATVEKLLSPYQVSVRQYPYPIAAATDFGRRPPITVIVGAWVGLTMIKQLVEQGRLAAEAAGFECSAVVVHDGHLEDQTRAELSAAGIVSATAETLGDVLSQFTSSFPMKMESIPDVD